MSCNGCRVLRKGCSQTCILRSCLHGIDSPQAQGNATLFLAKFFGRSDLMSFISAVPPTQRPALFQSLLFEACGRTVNPVNGAVGLLFSQNWHVCQAAVETVLAGGVLEPLRNIEGGRGGRCRKSSVHKRQRDMASSDSDEMSEMTTSTTRSWGSIDHVMQQEGSNERKILNLFV